MEQSPAVATCRPSQAGFVSRPVVITNGRAHTVTMDPIQAGGEESAPEIGVVLKTINDETFGVHLRRDALISELKTKVKVRMLLL